MDQDDAIDLIRTKECARCRAHRPLMEFRGPRGMLRTCEACREAMKAVRDGIVARRGRGYRTSLNAANNGLCGACKKPERWVDDYGRPRPLIAYAYRDSNTVAAQLCGRCAAIQHLAGDSVEVLAANMKFQADMALLAVAPPDTAVTARAEIPGGR